MAKIGLKKLVWAPFTNEPANAAPVYDTPTVLGKMVSSNLTFTKASGEFYADDEVAERVDDIVSGEFTAEVDHISLADQKKLYGAAAGTSDEVVDTNSDNPPYGGVGGYQVLLKGGEKIYRAYFLPKVKAAVPDDSGNTKTNSPSFGTQPVNMAVMFANDGKIRYRKDFTGSGAESSALSWVYGKFGASA